MNQQQIHFRFMLPQDSAGNIIHYGYFDSPFGRCFMAASQLGVCYLGFPAATQYKKVLEDVQSQWPASALLRDDDRLFSEFSALYNETTDIITVLVKGTPFQLRVWQALTQIPSGSVCTYSELAKRMGCASATRAVASAIAKNPVSLLVPCHRVVPKSGGVGQYLWGAECKRQLLEAEGVVMPEWIAGSAG